MTRMNLRRHIVVTPAVRVWLSVPGHPELTRTVQVPREAPSHWVFEAYLLSLGRSPGIETGDDVYGYPLLALRGGGETVQSIDGLPGVPGAVEAVVSAPLPVDLGEPRVSVVDDPAHVPEPRAEDFDWYTDPPPLRIDELNLELARRFGLAAPSLESSVLADLDDRLRSAAPIVIFASRLGPLRRLALRAHLADHGVLDPSPLSARQREVVTGSLRTLLTRIGTEGAPQDTDHGWLPPSFVDDVVESLGWGKKEGSRGVDGARPEDAGAAVVGLAREARLIRRFRGRVVVTKAGSRLLDRPPADVTDVFEALRNGWRGSTWRIQPRVVTLGLLAVADGTLRTLADLPSHVLPMVAAIDAEARADGGALAWNDEGWAVEPEGRPADIRHVRSLVASLSALSSPGAFGMITPEIRAVARLALL